MKSRVRDYVGVGLQFADWKNLIPGDIPARVCSDAPVARAQRPTGPWLQFGEVAEWLKAALC